MENQGNELHVYIKLPRKTHACPCCGSETNKIHDYREQKIKDIPFGRTTYVSHLKEKQTERILLARTHNSTMDALLNQKGYAARKYKIDIRFSVNNLSGIVMDSMDMTVVMNNLLDNAIEACQKIPQEMRNIYVQLILEDSLFLSVRNSSLPVVIVDNTIATTKIPAELHGYGLQNVKTVLEKYDAFFTMQYENGYFSFAAEIPNTLRS